LAWLPVPSPTWLARDRSRQFRQKVFWLSLGESTKVNVPKKKTRALEAMPSLNAGLSQGIQHRGLANATVAYDGDAL